MYPVYSLLTSLIFYCVAAAADSTASCDSMSVITCLMPAMTAFSEHPEMREVIAVLTEGKVPEFVPGQMPHFCRLLLSATKCSADFVGRCVPTDFTDAHDFIQGTSALVGACDKPGFLEKATPLTACGKSLQANKEYLACVRPISKKVEEMFRESSSRSGNSPLLDLLRSGHLTRDMCCVAKEFQACTSPQMAKCSAEVAAVNDQFFNAVYDAYDCSAKTAQGCGLELDSQSHDNDEL